MTRDFSILDNVLVDPDEHVEEILSGDFVDYPDGPYVFKNIQDRRGDQFHDFLEVHYPKLDIIFNFARQSPLNQEEPNFIHTDEMMGNVTALLYLNKEHPKEYGTTLYKVLEGNERSYDPDYIYRATYNSALIFDSTIPHSRNIFDNFGVGDNSRLVQVAFLNVKEGK